MSGGYLFLVIGIVGIFFPLLPTTPFLLLAAACFSRSSTKVYNRLLQHKWLGVYIKNYREGNGIPLKAKVMALFLLWTLIGIAVYLMVPLMIIKIILILIAGAVTVFILSHKTYKIDT